MPAPFAPDIPRLPIALLLLRLGIFLVMFMWTIDKFLHADHAAKVYEKYYFLGGLGGTVMFVLGALEILLLLGFVAGAFKRLTYGLVGLLHAVSTLSAWKIYLTPAEPYHLLFFAAWPMLTACIALYLLREHDTLFSIAAGHRGHTASHPPAHAAP